MMEVIVAIVILVFVFWTTSASQWIIAIAAVALLVHSFMCKNCTMSAAGGKRKK